MQNFFDFFVDPLIWPVYWAIVMYVFAWMGARFSSGIFARGIGVERGGIERGTIRAWRLMIILHLVVVTIFVGFLCFYAYPRVAEWTELLWYLVSYVPILVIDVCALISLASQKKKK